MNKYWRMCQHWSMLDSNKRNMRSICETYFNAYNDQNLFYKTLKWIRETSTLSSSKAFLFFQSFPGNEHKYWEVEFLLGFPYIDPYYRSASFHHINPYNLIFIFSHLSVCPIIPGIDCFMIHLKRHLFSWKTYQIWNKDQKLYENLMSR